MSGKDVTYPWTDGLTKYVITPDGTFVGDFEGLYRNCEDPWGQSIEAASSPLNQIIIARIAQLRERCVLDLGCGNGHSTELFRTQGNADVLGVEISPTAVANAKAKYPLCRFEVASAIEVAKFAHLRPTAICMCSLTWYILETFRALLASLREQFPGALLFHVLTFYGPGMQKYGTDYFTSLDELLPYFSAMTVEETFVHRVYPSDGLYSTLVVARV